MRSFPLAARRRVLAAISIAALALGAAVAPSVADDLDDQKQQAEQDVDNARDSLEESSARAQRSQAKLAGVRAQLDFAQTAVATAEGQAAVAAERDVAMQLELDQAEARLSEAEADLASGRADLDDQRGVVVGTITDYYQQGDPEMEALSSMITASSPEDLTRRRALREVIVDRETAAFDEFRATEILLKMRREDVAEARNEVAVQRQAAAANLAAKEQAEANARAARDDVRILVGQATDAQNRVDQIVAADKEALAAAQAEADRIAELLQERAADAVQEVNPGATVPPGGSVLSYPVNGPITSPYGMRKHPIYGYYGLHDGTDFGAGCGEPLFAPADGTVVSSFWSDVYGNRLVIDHGPVGGVSLASVYNHATSYSVGVGDRVKRGQVIGAVGTTGWSTGCHLHYTVMANGETVDPMNYL